MEHELLFVVTYRMQPGHRADFLQQVDQLGLDRFFRTEKGCLQYDYLLPAQSADELVLLERWQNADTQQRHIQTPQFEALRQIKEAHVRATSIEQFLPY